MKTTIMIVGIGAVLLCVVCGVGLFFFGRSTLQGFQAISQTSEQFLSHLKAGDFQAASQLIAPTAQATYTEAELRKRWNLLERAIGKVQGWSLSKYNIYTDTSGAVGTLTMRIQGDKGNGTVDFLLKPEGERWLITELRFGW
jgi:hypothetical protein